MSDMTTSSDAGADNSNRTTSALDPESAHKILMAIEDSPISFRRRDDKHVRVERSSVGSTPLERAAWPDLEESVIAQLRQVGTTETTQVGDVLFENEQSEYSFVFVEEGSVAVLDRSDDRTVTEVVAGDFTGEIGLLLGLRTSYAGVVTAPGRVISVPTERLRELIASVPDVGTPIINALAARRTLMGDPSEDRSET